MEAMQEGFQMAGRLYNNLTGRREAPGIRASGQIPGFGHPASGVGIRK